MKNKKTEKRNITLTPFSRNLIIMSLMILVAVTIVIIPNLFNKEEIKTPEFSSVNRICELSTMRCYYHNVAEYEVEPEWIHKYGWFEYGKKKIWIEYEGIIEYGIDMNEISIEKPNSEGIVKVYIPDAKVQLVDANEDSMETYIELGILTELTAEDEAIAYAQTQSDMEESAKNDKNALQQAKENAKQLISSYIKEVGKQLNQTYTIEWIE